MRSLAAQRAIEGGARPAHERLMRAAVIGIVGATLAAGCSNDPPTPSAKSAPVRSDPVAAAPEAPPAPPSPAAAPGVQADGQIVSAVDWFHGSLQQALAAAEREGKLVFVDVGAYWCPPCHRLDEEVFVDASVGEALGAGFIAVHVDAEAGDGPEIAERYHVQAFPTLLVLEPSGLEKGRVVDFVPAAELLEALQRIAEGGNVLADLQAKVESAPDDLQARYALANASLLAADPATARPHLEAILVADPRDELGLASKVLYDRALFVTYKIERDLPGAVAAFRELQARFPDSKPATRAYRQIGRILHEQGRSAEAIASLEAMVATDPDDTALKASFGWFSFRERCDPKAGLKMIDGALQQAPDDAELHYLRAELLHLLGDDRAALGAIEQASAAQPESAYYRRQVARFAGLAGVR